MNELRQRLDAAKKIVFFGGAGVSTESGIPDFRSGDGVFQAMRQFGHSPEELLYTTCLRDDPELFFSYYFKFLLYPEAKPNAAHRALAYLEQQGKLLGVITQNVDGLHQMAGSKNVMELHGSVYRNHCARCNRKYTLEEVQERAKAKAGSCVPRCDCGGVIRPDVVLYGESLDEAVMEEALQAIGRADTMIVGGTSLSVWPAAGLLNYFYGDSLILINKSPTSQDYRASLLIREGIGEVFKQAYPEILQGD